MPRVPMMDSPQVLPGAIPFTPFSDSGAAQAAAGVGRQAQESGQAMMQAGTTASNIAIDMQEQANQVQLNDAANKARAAQLDLTFNPQTGYKNLKGNAALTRPNGQALPDEYGDKFKSALGDIADGLGNEAQKRAFAMTSQNMFTSFQGDVEGHMLGEFRSHALSVQDGTIKIGTDTAKLNWDQPDKISPAIDSVKAAVVEAGRINGEAASETTAKMKVATSAVHTSVVAEALQNNNPEYALAYLNRNKDGMTADDLLRARGVVNKDIYARIADGTATNVVSGLRANVQPTDISRMHTITMQTESGGNRNAVGQFIPGQGTAKGEMQVMDATAAAPGHGIAPEDTAVPGDRARVGHQLLDALVSKYAGDPAKAWAAYNAGEGNVDKAIKDAGPTGNWLDALSKYQSTDNHTQTVNYVNKNVAALQSGGSTGARPTLQDVHDGIRAQITKQFGATPPMGVLDASLQAGTKQWEDLNNGLKAQGETAVRQAQQWLISNGGDFSKLPANLTTAVTQSDPGKMDDLATFAKHIARGENVTNMDAFNLAYAHPEELAKMPDSVFLQFQKTNFSNADQEKIAKLRANEMNATDDTSAGAINARAFNKAFDYRMNAIGVATPKPSDPPEVRADYGAKQKLITDYIYDQQQHALGRKATPEEIGKFVDDMFSKNATFRNTFLGVQYGTDMKPLMGLKVGDIPSESVDTLKASFAKRGNPNPNDADLLTAYLKWKSHGK